MYQEACCLNISSDIIKDMKIEPRNKWRKADLDKLNTSFETIYLELIKNSQHKLNTSQSIELTDVRI